MRTSTKTIAIVLSVVMVVCAFCATFTVSAEDTNLLLGKTCTFKNIGLWDGKYPADGSTDTTDLFTDGAFRGDGENAWNGINAVPGVTFDTTIAGPTSTSSYSGFYTFDLGESKEIAKVVVKGYRENGNRGWGQSNDAGDGLLIFVSDTAFDLVALNKTAEAAVFPVDGTNAVASYEKVAIADAPMAEDANGEPVAQYFDVTFNLAAGTTGRYLLVKTNGMVITGQYFQADEIEAYGPAANVPSEDVTSDDVTSDDVTSDDVTSDDVTSDDVTSDDVTSDDVTSDDVTSDDVTSDDVTSDDVTSDDVTSDDVTSDDVTSDDVTSDDVTSDDVTSEDPIVIADITFTVTLTDNGDGTATITATIPEGVISGKIVIETSADLEFVEGSLKSAVAGTCNEGYNRDGVTGECVSFASSVAYAADSEVFSATYNVADGADLDESDIIVDLWNLSGDAGRLGTQADGDVIKVIVDSGDDTSDDVTSDDVTSEDATSEDATSEDASAPIADDDNTPTGDAGMIAFAVLAVLSGAAVVVLKKRA